MMQSKRVLISGCSGGGKSTLLAELQSRGHHVVPEPGRRIVQEEVACGGDALPWVNPGAFAQRAFRMAQDDLKKPAEREGPIFFDRGLIDAALALASRSQHVVLNLLENQPRYHRLIFMAPPWPEIYRQDEERRHDFQTAVDEYEAFTQIVPVLGYDICIMPKIPVRRRADYLLRKLQESGTERFAAPSTS